jgi:hypothetical protein
MSRLNIEQYWVNYKGVTIKYSFQWWIPFKKLWLKTALFLADHMELIYTYDARTGATSDVKHRVWSSKKGVEL